MVGLDLGFDQVGQVVGLLKGATTATTLTGLLLLVEAAPCS